MSIQLVMTADAEGYYLCDADGENETDAADWGLPVEYKGASYIAASEDGETVRLFKCAEVDPSEFELVSEPDDDDDDSDEEGEDAEEEEEEAEGVEIE